MGGNTTTARGGGTGRTCPAPGPGSGVSSSVWLVIWTPDLIACADAAAMASLWGARTEDASGKGRWFAAALHERRGIGGLADFPRPPPDAAAPSPPLPSARPPAGAGGSGSGWPCAGHQQ